MKKETPDSTENMYSLDSKGMIWHTYQEAYEEEATRMVDYAELPAFSSLPSCVKGLLNEETVEKLKENDK